MGSGGRRRPPSVIRVRGEGTGNVVEGGEDGKEQGSGNGNGAKGGRIDGFAGAR